MRLNGEIKESDLTLLKDCQNVSREYYKDVYNACQDSLYDIFHCQEEIILHQIKEGTYKSTFSKTKESINPSYPTDYYF